MSGLESFYQDIVNGSSNLMCFIWYPLAFLQIPESGTTFDIIFASAISWFAFFHNTDIFPAPFIMSVDGVIVSAIINFVISFITNVKVLVKWW